MDQMLFFLKSSSMQARNTYNNFSQKKLEGRFSAIAKSNDWNVFWDVKWNIVHLATKTQI